MYRRLFYPVYFQLYSLSSLYYYFSYYYFKNLNQGAWENAHSPKTWILILSDKNLIISGHKDGPI